MQTFLPYPSFKDSATVLDRQRLGKQRIEVLQLVHSHISPTGWSNHHASMMWRGHTLSLIDYGIAVCDEWIRRGYNDSTRDKLVTMIEVLACQPKPTWIDTADPPWWMGDDAFHASHRSNLLRKDPVHYGRFGWYEPTTLSYLWPLTTPGEFVRSRE